VKCLILAAGEGNRLAGRGPSKPLLKVLGLTLIERIILTCMRADINDFVVVTGKNHHALEAELSAIAKRRGCSIQPVYNQNWKLDNGVSVLAARHLLKDRFLMLMADHFVDEETIESLIQHDYQDEGIVLAVDHRLLNRWVDTDEATKVLTKHDRIKNIGLKIDDFNAYDTGAFLCSPIVFEALEDVLSKKGNVSVTDGVLALAEKERAATLDIKRRSWLNINTPVTLDKAEGFLYAYQRKKSWDGPISQYINRPLSYVFTRFFIAKNWTPNRISVLAFGLAFIASLGLILPGQFFLAIGGIVAQLSSVIDGCDGEVARLKGMATATGGWFDAVLDRYADAMILAGLSFHAYRLYPTFSTLVIAFFAIVGSFMVSYTAVRYASLGTLPDPSPRFELRLGRDLRILIVFVAALMNRPLSGLLLIAIIMNVETFRRVKRVLRLRK